MLKFKELTAKDKRIRYQNAVKFPAFIIVALFTALGVNYVILSALVTTGKLIDLLYWGVWSDEIQYNYQNFSVDAVVLFVITAVSALVISPAITSHVTLENIVPFLEERFDITRLVATLLFTQLFWYISIRIQETTTNQPIRWKWKVTSLLTSPEIYF